MPRRVNTYPGPVPTADRHPGMFSNERLLEARLQHPRSWADSCGNPARESTGEPYGSPVDSRAQQDHRVFLLTGACYAHLAQDIWGGGYWYPGNTGPYHPEPYMSGGWDNQVSSIYLA